MERLSASHRCDADDPRLPTSASVRGGSCLRYTRHRTGATATAALTRTSDRLADGAWRTAPFQRCIVPYQSRSRRPVPLQIIARKRVDLGESESSHQPRSPMVVRACIENDGKEDEECQPKLWPPSASEKRVPRH